MWRPVAILPAALLIFLIPVARVIGGASTPPQGDVARGQYIVNHVAMCVQCHSPRDEAGRLTVPRGAGACVSDFKSSCAKGRGLEATTGVVVSPDSRNLYVTSLEPGGVAVFGR